MHLPEQVHRAVDVCVKANVAFRRILAEMCSQMDHYVVAGDPGSVRNIEHVELRTARKIISFKELTNMRA